MLFLVVRPRQWAQRVRTETSTLPFKVFGDFSSGTKSKMARPEGETSNSLLDTLADWNTYLEQHAPSYRDVARWGT